MMRCPSCLLEISGGYKELGEHLYSEQEKTDADHITWISRYVTRNRTSLDEFTSMVEDVFSTDDLKGWILRRFIAKFLTETPHPFLVSMQHPSRYTMLGYAFEHHHFLKQWVKSCASIISNTDEEDVHHYEIDNIVSEWRGMGESLPSHHELLLRMGESYGATREDIYGTEPLEATVNATRTWDYICRNLSFVEGMVAMHSLELLANRKMRDYGASTSYFDASILRDGSTTQGTVNFLKEGYDADVSHSEQALDLIVRYAGKLDMVQPVQAVFFRTIEELDNYLNARMERGMILEDQQY